MSQASQSHFSIPLAALAPFAHKQTSCSSQAKRTPSAEYDNARNFNSTKAYCVGITESVAAFLPTEPKRAAMQNPFARDTNTHPLGTNTFPFRNISKYGVGVMQRSKNTVLFRNKIL